MQHLERSGAPVLYIGRTVLKGSISHRVTWAVYTSHSVTWAIYT